MNNSLHVGESVRYRARAKWGIGKITSINSCGTVRVVFGGNKILSIAKGINYLRKRELTIFTKNQKINRGNTRT